MLFSNDKGEIFDHPDLLLMADYGSGPELIKKEDLIELPRGSDLLMLPDRTPLGFNPKTKKTELFKEYQHQPTHAVASFLAPTYTQLARSVYQTNENAPILPLFAYTPVGIYKEQYYVPAIKVDTDIRQDPWLFNLQKVSQEVKTRRNLMPHNTVIQQLETCAMSYQCRAAQNYFLGRFEGPIPTSLRCNSNCTGCISLQPKGTGFRAAHDRLRKSPSADEIAEMAIDHISRVGKSAIVSFGQGCEGEPLLMGHVLVKAIQLIRQKTTHGIINVNTNGSKPDLIHQMCEVGLNSIRVSMNSPREEIYNAYYKPYQYSINDIFKSLKIVNSFNAHTSINLLVFPGLTDTEEEFKQMSMLIEQTNLKMIQMRNLNIDPEIYIQSLPKGTVHKGLGLRQWMKLLKKKFPNLLYGYFNPNFS